MKVYKIVLFIFITIFCLGLICYFFPSNGLTIGNITLRFPSMEKILTRGAANNVPTEIIEPEHMEDIIKKQELSSIEDSLNLYKELMTNHVSHFYLPNDNYNFFDSFFDELATAKADGRIIRVLHYGDSQIEIDRISKELRQFFQNRFGGGGPGLLPIVQVVPTSSVTQSASENFVPYMAYGIGNRDSRNQYGIMAKYYHLNGSGNCRFSNMRTNKVRLILDDKKGNFSATLKNKNAEIDLPQTCDSTIGFKIVEWNLSEAISSFSLNVTGNADLYGIMVDNGSGVAVDNIPMRGCSGTIFTKLGGQLIQETYQKTDVGLIILQYGGNAMPGIQSARGVTYYKKQIGEQIRYLKSLNPNIPILLIGPADMATRVNGELRSYPMLAETIEALKEVALENGAAFWNIYEVMGGENSIITWYNHGLAGADYIHFTPAGANKIGSYLTDAFSTIYDYYCVSNSLK